MPVDPKVSVIMPIYNGERYLAATIESILNQTYTNFELILIDDASSDDSQSIAAKFTNLDDRIILLRNHKNQDISRARNRGLDAARGEYIACMDHDDLAKPERLGKQVEFLDANEEIGVLGSFAEIIDEIDTKTAVWSMPTNSILLGWLTLFGNWIIHPTVMMRRSIALEAGGYDPQKPLEGDYDLWTRLHLKTRFAIFPEVLSAYRSHPHQNSQQNAAVHLAGVKMCRYAAMCRLLGARVPPQAANQLAQLMSGHLPGEVESIGQMAQLIQELYINFCNKAVLNDQERRVVAADVSLRLYTLARHSLRHSWRTARQLALKSWTYDAWLPMRIATRRIKRPAHKFSEQILPSEKITYG